MKEMDFIGLPKERKTPEACLALVENNGSAIRCIPWNRLTPKIWLAAVKKDGEALYWMDLGFLGMGPFTESDLAEIYLTAVQQWSLALMYVPQEKQTREMCLTALSQDISVERYSRYSLLELLYGE